MECVRPPRHPDLDRGRRPPEPAWTLYEGAGIWNPPSDASWLWPPWTTDSTGGAAEGLPASDRPASRPMGGPDGIRTRVSGLKGRRPRPAGRRGLCAGSLRAWPRNLTAPSESARAGGISPGAGAPGSNSTQLEVADGAAGEAAEGSGLSWSAERRALPCRAVPGAPADRGTRPL